MGAERRGEVEERSRPEDWSVRSANVLDNGRPGVVWLDDLDVGMRGLKTLLEILA